MGGPQREMFRLVLNEIKDSLLFMGADNSKYIMLNKDSLEQRKYFEIGRIIVLAVVHTGLPPKFFSEFLFRLIIGDTDTLVPTKNDIVDDDIRNEINLAESAQDLNSLRSVLYEGTYFRLAGWENIDDFTRKDNMINDVLRFYAIERVEKCVYQLIEGLQIMDFYKYMKEFPEYFIEVMCSSNTRVLDVTAFETLFEINLSEQGSTKRHIENRVLVFWQDYLEDCYEVESSNSSQVTLGDVLAFCTGSNVVPLFGFSQL